jgi:hypothetical protein
MLQDKAYYSRLKNSFSLVIIFIAVVPLFLISWNSKHFYQESSLQNTTEELKRTVENRKQVIALFLDDQKELLSQLMRLYSYDDLKDQTQLERIFAAVAATGIIVDMDVFDEEGRHISYVGPYREKFIGKIYKNEKWFKDVMPHSAILSQVY